MVESFTADSYISRKLYGRYWFQDVPWTGQNLRTVVTGSLIQPWAGQMQTLTASRRTVTWHPFSQLKKMSFLLLSLWPMIETLSGWEDMRRMMWRVPGSGQTGLLSPATQTGDKDSQTIWMVMKTACVWWILDMMDSLMILTAHRRKSFYAKSEEGQ